MAVHYIEAFYNAETENEQDDVLAQITDDDLEILKWIVLDTTLYGSLYLKNSPELLTPPAGYKRRT